MTIRASPNTNKLSTRQTPTTKTTTIISNCGVWSSGFSHHSLRYQHQHISNCGVWSSGFSHHSLRHQHQHNCSVWSSGFFPTIHCVINISISCSRCHCLTINQTILGIPTYVVMNVSTFKYLPCLCTRLWT
jgi:hypothetical protein